MKTILVTGAAGYIGRHVVKKALDMGYRVIASDFAFKGVDERAEFCDVPIFSGDKNIYAALGKPDVCIHMAWRDGFRHNAPSHMKDLSSHVTFLNNMAAGGLSDLTVMGTMHEVGYWEGAIEDDTPCNPLSQYGIAKNALRQSMMLSLQAAAATCTGCAPIILRATKPTEVPSLPKSHRQSWTAKQRSRLPAGRISTILLIWMNWQP